MKSTTNRTESCMVGRLDQWVIGLVQNAKFPIDGIRL